MDKPFPSEEVAATSFRACTRGTGYNYSHAFFRSVAVAVEAAVDRCAAEPVAAVVFKFFDPGGEALVAPLDIGDFVVNELELQAGVLGSLNKL